MRSTSNGKRLTRNAFWGSYGGCSVIQLPSLDDYWSRDPLTHYAPIAMKIPRWRFREISRYLHFVDNQHLAPRGSPTFPPCNRVSSSQPPSKNVAVDEAMQAVYAYEADQADQAWAQSLKVWVLGDSTNGFALRCTRGKERYKHVRLVSGNTW